MCTAVAWNGLFGRNLDLEYDYDETVTVTPRNYPLPFREAGELPAHYAMIGMAHVVQGMPLYYDGMNEKGLCMAALNFPGNAYYGASVDGKDNVAPFELFPWVLGQCATVEEAEALLSRLNLIDCPFSDELPLTPLHWMISDGTQSIVVEPLREGLRICENPVGVLTNNPPFLWHMTNLANYLQLSAEPPVNRLGVPVEAYSRGMGAMGLPGDPSSASRFVRAVFLARQAVAEQTQAGQITQFYHILRGVEQQKGAVVLQPGVYQYTRYAACCVPDDGLYCYCTYGSGGVMAVRLSGAAPEGCQLLSYPILQDLNMKIQNE